MIEEPINESIEATIRKMIRDEFNAAFEEEEIYAKINSIIVQFDRNLSKMIVEVNERMDSLEQDLLDTISALKKYMDVNDGANTNSTVDIP